MGPQQWAWAVTAAAVAAVFAGCDGATRKILLASVVIAGCGGSMTLHYITAFRETFVNAGRFGIDLNKATTPRDPATGALIRPIKGVKVPETMGLVVGAVFICCVSVFLPFAFDYEEKAAERRAGGGRQLVELVAALLSITFAVLLGFADDVLDVRWRHKVPLSFAPTLPLLLVYHAHIGVTAVVVPAPLRGLIGLESLDLGYLYYVALALQAVFCTHTINILAGVNGLESGQSVVIGASIIALNAYQLSQAPADWTDYRGNQLFSLYIAIPFTACSAALWYHNWWPSAVFVGDTFCYFAGMTLAACAILGHNSKTLWLFFIPQLINFAYSLPQLIPRCIPIPRHRMPAFDTATGNVKLSFVSPEPFRPDELSSLGKAVFGVLSTFRLAHIERLPDGSVRMGNLTLICFFLYVFGPCREDQLCIRLLAFQVMCCAGAFVIRFCVAGLFYDQIISQ